MKEMSEQELFDAMLISRQKPEITCEDCGEKWKHFHQCLKYKGKEMKRERIECLGELKQKLSELMDLEIFDNLSKHDECWDPERTDIYDQLDLCRMQFGLIQDKICECYEIAAGDEDNV
jgi:hypothetical protein